jgi:hypothetical protein
VSEPVRVHDLTDQEGQQLQRIVRRAASVRCAIGARLVLVPDGPQRRAWRIFNRPIPMVPEIRILGPPGRERGRVL